MVEMRRARITLTALAAFALALAAAAASATGVTATAEEGPPTTGRALIEVRTPELPTGEAPTAAKRRDSILARSRRLLQKVAAREEIEIAGRSEAAGLLATELDGAGIAGLRERLASDPLVESVRPEYRAELRYSPNDPIFGIADVHAPGADFSQWPLLLGSFPKAWDLGKGVGAEVAVIDSGADITHPDLAGRISSTLDCSGAICLGTAVTDTKGHGTHVSGLACADSDSGYGLASAGFDCSLFVVKTDLSYLSIINSIYAAADRGSTVINMSFGGGAADTDLRDALDYALGRGAVLVAAGDNNPTPDPSTNYPAQYLQPEGTGPNIDAGKGLVVTSASHTGARSAFAQKTSGVSIAAYGSATDALSGGQQGILSTWPQGVVDLDAYGVRTTIGSDTRFAYLVGTSMAAPQVAGLAALMRAAKPALSAAKLIRLVKLTASNCGPYGSAGLGWGLIQAHRAVAAALDKDIDLPSSEVVRAKRSRRGNASLVLKSSDGSACSKELPASGLETVNVFASANGGAYRRIAKTKKDKLRFRGKAGRKYRFYSVAVDKAGNREDAPAIADAKLRVKRRPRR